MAYSENEIISAEDILTRLDQLDILCELNEIKGELMLLGGAALLLHMIRADRTFRPTQDIDVFVLETTKDTIYRQLEEVKIDIVDGIVELPPIEDFREDKEYEIGSEFTSIRVFVPSRELLACTKIFSTRQKDLDDLLNTEFLELCDKEKLKILLDEYKDYFMNLEHPDLNYHQIIELLN